MPSQAGFEAQLSTTSILSSSTIASAPFWKTPLATSRSTRRDQYLLPRICPDPARIQSTALPTGFPGRDILRFRAPLQSGRRFALQPAPSGILDDVERRRWPALRKRLHMAVSARLAEA